MEAVFKQLFYDYFHKLYGYALTIVKDEEEAKDIVQTAFIKCWEKRKNIQLATAGSYLYTSVYHLGLNAIRNRSTRTIHEREMIRDMKDNFNWILEEKELDTRVMKAIQDLSPKCRQVFVKSRFERKKYGEIAKELGISVKTVEAQIGKALKMLRAELTTVTIILIYLAL